ncbi:hypothetical protein BZZ01_26510 [Nostocales cyanobacterium HT-58-2]|nr:hypothetical protein BZZ01_26510 [Nostocales cyanobacterium HT-58-2]
MHAFAQVLSLPSLNSAIDFSPLTVSPDTPLSDVVVLMSQRQPQANCALIVENLRVVGSFTGQDALQLLYSDVDLRAVKVSQVMGTSVLTLKLSEVSTMESLLSLLRLHSLFQIPLVDEQGQLVGLVTYESICQALEQEVGARGGKLERTEAQQWLLEAAFANAGDAIVIIEADRLDDPLSWRIVYANEAFAHISGWLTCEIIGKTLPTVYGEKTSSSEIARICAALRGGSSIRTELIQYHKNGSTHWVEINISPIAYSEDKITHFICTQRNITERKLAEEALRSSEEQFRILVDEAPVLIWMNDANALGSFCNQASMVLIGRPLQELLGESWTEGIHPEDKQRCFEIYLSAVKKHERFQFVFRYLYADGEYRWLINTGVPRFGADGSFVGYIGCCTDITEHMQAEVTLKQVQAELKQANAELEIRIEERTRAIKQINRQLIYEMTDRLYVEEQLRQSQEMLQLIMDNIPQSIFWKDTASVFLGCNRVFAETAGLESPEDVVGKTDYDLVAKKEEADLYYESDLRVMQTDTPEYRVIFPHLRKNGKQAWLEVNKIPLHDNEGNVMGILGTFEDITARKQAEEALKRSEERFRNLVEISSDWVWEVDENAVYTYVSPKVFEMLGYQPQEILGKTPFDFMPSEEIERIANIFTPILTTQKPLKCLENTAIHKDGHLVILESSGVPIFDADGKFRGYRGIDRDITERKQAEASLRETQERLQAILDNSPAFIYLVDSQNRYLLINHHYEKIFKVTKEQIIGKTMHDIWHHHIADKLAANNRKVFTEGIPIETEEIVPQADGIHTNLSIKFPLKDANGIPYAVGGISTDITERKLAEEALLRFRKAIESASDAIGMADITGQVIYLNPAFVELFEYTLEELQAEGGPSAIYTNKAQCKQIFANVNKGESWRGEVTMKTRYGRIIQVEVRGNAIKDATGKIIGSVGIHTDITERKQAEESLRLRDRAIAASNNGIMIADVTMPSCPIIYANPALEQITGYSVAEVIGNNCCFLHGSDINQPGITALYEAITKGKSCNLVLRSYRKDGTLFWNEINISPVYDNDGKFTHCISIQTDITERKQAEVALLISQERLQYLLSSSPGVIYSCKISSDYGVTFMSENVISMLGYEAREFIETSSFWKNHIHTEDQQQVSVAMSTLLEQGQHSQEYRFLHKDGTYRWMYDQAKLIKDDAGHPLEIVGYWLDITERKQLEEEIKAALCKEKELNELKSRFVSMTSHEFRTPLSTILSSSELLEHYRHKWTEEKQLSHLHRIQTAVKHMTEMLNNVLVIGKAEAGKLNFLPEPLDLVEYCYSQVEEIQLNINNQHAINFSTQYKSMPCCMDEKLLGHILSNLLSNAIKYSPTSSTVKFTLSFKDDLAIFTIQDQGIGIPTEDLPHLFESFYRATNVGNIQGTGLGLAIVKKCVDIHNGEITVKSKVGEGTIFNVTLPLNNYLNSKTSHDQNFNH